MIYLKIQVNGLVDHEKFCTLKIETRLTIIEKPAVPRIRLAVKKMTEKELTQKREKTRRENCLVSELSEKLFILICF